MEDHAASTVMSASETPTAVSNPIVDFQQFENRPFVYLLPTLDRNRVKIGRSRVPLDRISSLLATHPEIDLTRAALIEVDSNRLESALHTVFERHRSPLEDHVDGYTEWFDGDLVDDVIDFCQLIADKRRGCLYPVLRNLESTLHAYRLANPSSSGERAAATEKTRQISRIEIRREFIDKALAHVDNLIDQLTEKELDGVMLYGGTEYVVRTVRRDEEPEIWQPGADDFSSTDWGQRLLDTAYVRLAEGWAMCYFRILCFYPFHAIDQQRGYEIYRILHDADRTGDAEPAARALEAFRPFLDTLPRISPSDLRTSLKYD